MSTEVNSTSPSVSQQQITPVQRKLQKILDLKLESDKDLIDSLKYLSGFFNENSVRTRRSLRSTIEKRSLTLNDQFEECFRLVKEQLDQVNHTVTSMSSCCEDMTRRLKVRENGSLIFSLKARSALECQSTDAGVNRQNNTDTRRKVRRGSSWMRLI